MHPLKCRRESLVKAALKKEREHGKLMAQLQQLASRGPSAHHVRDVVLFGKEVNDIERLTLLVPGPVPHFRLSLI